MDKRIVAGAALTLGLVLFADFSLAQDGISARIFSLGGSVVSGIIPDLYTDLSINPAYACLADRLTCNYGRRNTSGFDMLFPHLSGGVTGHQYGTDEVSIYGMRISNWRAALSAQWQLGQDESNESRTEIGTQQHPYIAALHAYDGSDDDFARIDLVAARPIGERSIVGFRLQASGYYNSYSYILSRETDWFANGPFTEIAEKYTFYQATPRHGRELCFDFKAGVARRAGTGIESELVLRASRCSLDYRNQTYSLETSENYNAGQVLYDYWYLKKVGNDAREGSLWIYGLSLRHTFRGGIRVYSGGSLSTGSYDAEWTDDERYISWDYSTNDERMASGEFTGTGSQWEASYFLKGGKTVSLLEILDLTIGLYGGLRRTHAEESPVIHYSQSLDEGDTIRIDQPSSLKYTGTSVDIYVPLAVEFRPASYFSFFSGFRIHGRWSKEVTEKPALTLFDYRPPHTAFIPGGASRSAAAGQAVIIPETSVTDWRRAWYTDNTVTLGFSLHYRDRFFIDVYSEAAIVPTISYDRMIDVRYVF
jgi:hypothetical protein